MRLPSKYLCISKLIYNNLLGVSIVLPSITFINLVFKHKPIIYRECSTFVDGSTFQQP